MDKEQHDSDWLHTSCANDAFDLKQDMSKLQISPNSGLNNETVEPTQVSTSSSTEEKGDSQNELDEESILITTKSFNRWIIDVNESSNGSELDSNLAGDDDSRNEDGSNVDKVVCHAGTVGFHQVALAVVVVAHWCHKSRKCGRGCCVSWC